ncbi:hypothetical protein [Streptococcus sp.]|jgi:magnesium-transporting ATPase (P-type)|uniref:hypothetical protein n=1 Tax=Streptococcus sp. TaxID=1306 RepID=UPI0017B21F4E|nr:hypothetical protein [Streptococcus sp.]HHU65139.1 hypothetical protein [Streptococcus sp.]
MKKTLYLSILLGTSVLATLIRVYSVFFAKLNKLSNYTTGDVEIDNLLSESAIVIEKQHAFLTNYINKLFVIVMILTLLVSLYYLIRKDLKAVYSYFTYLVLALISACYRFVSLKPLVKFYSDDMMKTSIYTGENYRLVFSVVIFLVYIFIIIFNNKLKSNTKLISSAGIDV